MLDFILGCLFLMATVFYSIFTLAAAVATVDLFRERRREKRLRSALNSLPPNEAFDYYLEHLMSGKDARPVTRR